MAETLGSLCDKLTIIKLKQYHTSDKVRLGSLSEQELQLIDEIDQYLDNAFSGKIPPEKMRFAANKIYKQSGNETRNIQGNIGAVFSELSKVNCELWHEQEKVYEFEKVPIAEKDIVVKRLAILNLERNQCMDAINEQLFILCKT